jgi:NADH:ubiquinone oxidoreductase subunit 3 (subunit A)
MMNEWLFSPPAVFIMILAASLVMYLVFSRISFRRAKQPDGLKESYSCGEETPDKTVTPDYSQFFHFAFFFTVLHVGALIISMVPVGTIITYSMAALYVLGAVVGLFILLEK